MSSFFIFILSNVRFSKHLLVQKVWMCVPQLPIPHWRESSHWVTCWPGKTLKIDSKIKQTAEHKIKQEQNIYRFTGTRKTRKSPTKGGATMNQILAGHEIKSQREHQSQAATAELQLTSKWMNESESELWEREAPPPLNSALQNKLYFQQKKTVEHFKICFQPSMVLRKKQVSQNTALRIKKHKLNTVIGQILLKKSSIYFLKCSSPPKGFRARRMADTILGTSFWQWTVIQNCWIT